MSTSYMNYVKDGDESNCPWNNYGKDEEETLQITSDHISKFQELDECEDNEWPAHSYFKVGDYYHISRSCLQVYEHVYDHPLTNMKDVHYTHYEPHLLKNKYCYVNNCIHHVIEYIPEIDSYSYNYMTGTKLYKLLNENGLSNEHFKNVYNTYMLNKYDYERQLSS